MGAHSIRHQGWNWQAALQQEHPTCLCALPDTHLCTHLCCWQVFKKSFWNNLIGGIIIDLGMGGSAHWWKNKHNQHHATPNKMTDGKGAAVDPDIDTVPLIAWDEAFLKQVAPGDRGIISMQHIVVWPLLMLGYINWQIQGVIHLTSFHTVTRKVRRLELSAIALHHAWVLFCIFYNLSFMSGLLYWTVSHFLTGFGIAFVFIQVGVACTRFTGVASWACAHNDSIRGNLPAWGGAWVSRSV